MPYKVAVEYWTKEPEAGVNVTWLIAAVLDQKLAPNAAQEVEALFSVVLSEDELLYVDPA